MNETATLQDLEILRQLTDLGLPLQAMYVQRLSGFGYARSLAVIQRLQGAGLGLDSRCGEYGVERMKSETELENHLVERIEGPTSDLAAIVIEDSTSAARTLKDLCGDMAFKVFKDRSEWNPRPKEMVDVIGGMTPDIVLRSQVSGQNRIYIEVKERESLSRRYGRHGSQAVRYFLHLLASTEQNPSGKDDIGRAMLLAAPAYWFEGRTGEDWLYFVEKYTDLAQAFNITLGRVVLEAS